MSKLFGPNASFPQMLGRVSDLVFLNLLTLLCSVPIITGGAAIAALYDAVVRLQRSEAKIYRGFFKAFGKYFLRATALWIPVLLVLVGVVYNLVAGATLPFALGLVILALVTAVLSWAYPMLPEFGEGVRATLKRAMKCAPSELKRTAIMTVLNLLPVLLFFFLNPIFWNSFMIWVFLYFALIAWFNRAIVNKVFEELAEEE